MQSGSLALGTLGLPAAAWDRGRRAGGRSRVLVQVLLRGGMDGLMAVGPVRGEALAGVRPRLAMSGAFGRDASRLIDLDGVFGLHPALGPLYPLYRDGRLALVHGAGLPGDTRSHFTAQDRVDAGMTGGEDGWLNRVLAHTARGERQSAVAVCGGVVPRSCAGRHPVALLPADRDAGVPASYPDSALGVRLDRVAACIRAGTGVEVACVEAGGWDTHVAQGTTDGLFAARASDLAHSIAAFWADVQDFHDDVVLMTVTEFGRTVAEESAGGTGHGLASCWFVLGGRVRGGHVYGGDSIRDAPGLPSRRVLPVEVDARRLYRAVAEHHFGVPAGVIPAPGLPGPRLSLFA